MSALYRLYFISTVLEIVTFWLVMADIVPKTCTFNNKILLMKNVNKYFNKMGKIRFNVFNYLKSNTSSVWEIIDLMSQATDV